VFSKYKLPYTALPEIDLSEIDLSTQFMGSKISFPFIISSMTGGPEKGSIINKNIAIAAEKIGVPFGVGSMRVIIKHPESIASFDVKKYAPNVKLFANVGLVQLNYGFGIDEIKRIIDSIKADGIFFHINPLQEAIQPEGDTNYKNLIPKFEKLLKKINIPVIVKEVGTGIDYKTAKALKDIGVQWIDVSGHGGTHWGWVEGYRGDKDTGDLFKDVGIPTDVAIKDVSKIKDLNIIAGGGIRSGLDIAKSLVLGANMATSAKPFLKASLSSPEEVIKVLERYKKELQIALFSVGASNISELKKKKLIEY
jgi:isopentenyl-diphosphate delta-isomerase